MQRFQDREAMLARLAEVEENHRVALRAERGFSAAALVHPIDGETGLTQLAPDSGAGDGIVLDQK
jgi:hypothetical protein